MKSVLIVSAVFPPEVAAAGFMAEELAQELVKNGHKVLIIAGWPSYPDGYLFKGWNSKFISEVKNEGNLRIIRVRHIFGNRKRNVVKFLYFLTFGFSSFLAGLFKGRYDTVLCFSTPFFGTWTSWFLAKIKRAAYFNVMFDLHPESSKNAGILSEKSMLYRFWYWQDSLLCSKSDHIITLTEPMRNEIIRRDIPGNIINVIPFWIDTERIKPGIGLNSWRTENEIGADKFIVLYAGTIGYISGAEILVDVARLLKENGNILILMVGEGVIKEKLMLRAEQADCTNMRFLPFQQEERLADLMSACDVGLVTLLKDAGKTSVPSKILAYMAAGKPVIASVEKDSGTAELINSSNCGILAECQDATSLAESIDFAYRNQDGIRMMGERGRKFVIEKYSKEFCTAQYLKLINNN